MRRYQPAAASSWNASRGDLQEITECRVYYLITQLSVFSNIHTRICCESQPRVSMNRCARGEASTTHVSVPVQDLPVNCRITEQRTPHGKEARTTSELTTKDRCFHYRSCTIHLFWDCHLSLCLVGEGSRGENWRWELPSHSYEDLIPVFLLGLKLKSRYSRYREPDRPGASSRQTGPWKEAEECATPPPALRIRVLHNSDWYP